MCRARPACHSAHPHLQETMGASSNDRQAQLSVRSILFTHLHTHHTSNEAKCKSSPRVRHKHFYAALVLHLLFVGPLLPQAQSAMARTIYATHHPSLHRPCYGPLDVC